MHLNGFYLRLNSAPRTQVKNDKRCTSTNDWKPHQKV